MIKFENVTKYYSGRKILDSLCLEIAEGDRITIIGPSGSGKSTLLKLLMGLHLPDAGAVYVDGEDITQMNRHDLQRVRFKLGLLFQHAALFDSMNVEDNVSFTLRENLNWDEKRIRHRVKELLEMVEMSGFEKNMPSDLSGGQMKRIGLARALAHNPRALMFDEPTTGLDPILSTNIENLMVKLSVKLNITSIIVTHQLSTILRTADKIYLLHEGKLLPPESPKTISDSKNKIIRNFIRGGL